MPLRDHFHPPISTRKSWSSALAGWACELTKRLNLSVLPTGIDCWPHILRGHPVDLETEADAPDNPTVVGGEGRTSFTPTGVPLTGAVALLEQDVFEVQVCRNDGGWKLVAAIELVSPANKDRPSSRRTFATKVAAYLQRAVSVVVVDVVTERAANLHDDLVQQLQLADGFAWQSPTGLSAVSYRVVRENGAERLDGWPFALALGEPLPTVPLWLNPVLAVPLELEPTYEETCDALRIA
ncbi:MAG TPA: DUF4058 family protein [Urbifossiella sp.]|nr:DUF4058 family protein [Urbifossiella sp.]